MTDHRLSYLHQATDDPSIQLLKVVPVGGGSINRCVKLETNKGFFFLKENDAEKYPGMFRAEAKGLALLGNAGTLAVPGVYGNAETAKDLLLLEWLERRAPGKGDWFAAGAALAKLHRHSAEQFGLDHDNYIGSLRQSNTRHRSWEDFFTLERILPQIKLARDGGRISAAVAGSAERFCAKAGEIFPQELPALLHGDLWSGNFFFSTKGPLKEHNVCPSGGPAVFDPAVYYGHREMDLAMTQLFGGFDADLYAGYENEFQLEKSWKQRVELCNVYPLLVHVNLFGGGYIEDVKRVLNRF
jgi:protein-ribulosamine 3-kinase